MSAFPSDEPPLTEHKEQGEMDDDVHGDIPRGAEARHRPMLGRRSSFFAAANVEMEHELDGRRPSISTRKPSIFSNIGDAPTWPPEHDFSFPVGTIPVLSQPEKDMTISMFSNMKHLADGSNSNIYLANYKGKAVIIKQLMADVKDDYVACQELDIEHGLLARINHPNIIKLYGSGVHDGRKFLVMQYLGGGTLRYRFDRTVAAKKQTFFGGKNTFTYPEALEYARQLATALAHLHSDVHPGAVVVHRDLKPDNVAFTEDGTLVLFDLGLCALINERATVSQTYQMTGGTGSLRYMAPEVALNQPYSEKADVYSFGVIFWQMLRDEMPYSGASRVSYLKYACTMGERPDLPLTWTKEVKELVAACWHQDSTERPAFKDVCVSLEVLCAKNPIKK